ncbi:topoisomerase 1-associated factor 1 [Ophiostoma piceae UAMH 11346]|uniref:Topoisomerase 1-associated factor 1 n=1 Tax=Ophiostoma piceae (strain UAMH 11346) TaxID=1262450 RepID=S3C015_OPHP1|nr:topoisomerase 1-associated factor 1 [Ophiostoma piceae UAMH 11346]
MEQNEAPADVVHPEVRAHINSLVSALGGFDEDGQYQLGDDALEVLRDIKKWMRFYDQKLNRMDVARCVSETNLVNGDILAILASWHENATLQRFRSRVALACYELMTPLTWPLEKDAETATVNYYRHLPVLRLAQVGYKRAIINYDGAQILHTAIRVALPSMAVPLGDRTLRDQGIIRLVLFFLRNIVMIEPPAGVKYDGDESQISRSATIDAFSYQEIFLVLLTMASNMGEDFRTEDSTVMEIIFHLVKGVDTAKLFMNETQLSTAKASELTDMMKKEEAMIHAFNQNGPTRHSRFGTMVWVDRGEGKMSALSGQDALLSSAAREQKMDNSKKYRPPRRGRKGPDKKDLVGLGAQISLNARANGQLRKFVEEFLDAGFNPLFQHVRRSIDREAPHILHHHRAQFFYLVSWFLAAERARQKAQQSKLKSGQRKPAANPADEITSFNLVAGVLNQEMFIFMGRALDRSYNDKDWKELSVVMRCFTQILLTVQEMYESGNEDDEEIAENILSRLFYEDTTHDAIANIIKSYKDQGLDYLDACTELVHTYLRILEAYSKQNVDLQVRSRQRTRKKKKAAKAAANAAAAGIDASADGAESLVPDAQADDDDSANDEEMAQKASSERKFDFKKFANRFVSQGVVDTFVKFTANYKDMTDDQLKRAHRYFYRVAFKQDMSVMLFRVDIIKLFYDMIKGTTPLDRHSSMYREWEELSKQILRRCMKKIEDRPVLIIEMLFSKTPSTAHFLEYGFEKQTVSTTTSKAAAEHEFREPDLERDRQIAILIAVLLNKNQHELITWIRGQIGMAGAERRAWKSAEAARALSATETSASRPEGEDGPSEALAELAAVVANDAPTITIRAADDACKKAIFKNPHLRLLMKLVGFERLAPSLDETPDSIWVVPSHITADELEESLEFISRAEFEPPSFENDQSAEDQLRRKPATRKKADFDDDNGGLDDDEVLFPAGGPTARKVVEEPKRKTIRRRRRKALASDDEDGLEGPTEEELDEKARQRREKELEKARRVKSDMYVHASDDETDDEKDREFFMREEATRKRIQDLAALVSTQPRPSVLASASAGSTKSKPTKSKPKAKRKSNVLSDDSSDDDDESTLSSSSDEEEEMEKTSAPTGDADSGAMDLDDALPSTSVLSEIQLNGSSNTPNKIDAASKAAGNTVDDDDDDDDDLPVQKRPRAKAGFVIDSDDE